MTALSTRSPSLSQKIASAPAVRTRPCREDDGVCPVSPAERAPLNKLCVRTMLGSVTERSELPSLWHVELPSGHGSQHLPALRGFPLGCLQQASQDRRAKRNTGISGRGIIHRRKHPLLEYGEPLEFV